MPTIKEYASRVSQEVTAVFQCLDEEECDRLAEALVRAQKVFLIAVGRVFLSLQCFGKRLGHLGIDVQVVGSVTEKPITPQDVLVVASGSGESKVPVLITRLAREKGAVIALITSAPVSTLKDMADLCVTIPCPTKNDSHRGVESIQPMSTLFDQALHLLGDAVALKISEMKQLKKEELWKYHANLE
ncbi:MAG: SIS domain-containing protein [Candidatus Atribacteria bacterium]|nr:SIS domain-containing protein [Candidatus Atribacteria bacterium]